MFFLQNSEASWSTRLACYALQEERGKRSELFYKTTCWFKKNDPSVWRKQAVGLKKISHRFSRGKKKQTTIDWKCAFYDVSAAKVWYLWQQKTQTAVGGAYVRMHERRTSARLIVPHQISKQPKLSFLTSTNTKTRMTQRKKCSFPRYFHSLG